jgi:hypothetical protein
MNDIKPKVDLPPSDSDVIREIRSVVKSTVMVDMVWYRKYSLSAGRAHRAAGVSIIALSASLPLIATQNPQSFPKRDLVISVVGVLIAVIAGLNAFFRFGELWKTNMRGMVELKNQLASWELQMLEAQTSQDGVRIAVEATKELLGVLKNIDTRNAEDYISTINFPGKSP